MAPEDIEPQQVASCELSILMPCLNEAETLGICIRNARAFLSNAAVNGEVLVADNGSQMDQLTSLYVKERAVYP